MNSTDIFRYIKLAQFMAHKDLRIILAMSAPFIEFGFSIKRRTNSQQYRDSRADRTAAKI